jgi:hypothetical protein
MAMTSAMIAAVAGCSSSESSDTSTTTTGSSEGATTTAAAEGGDQTDATTAAEENGSTAPGYTVEEGKVIDFEDGNTDFIKLNLATLSADECSVEVADFNGSKALKLTPDSTMVGKQFNVGFDLDALLGDRVTEVASVSFQAGVEAKDGNFYACSGTVLQNYTDASTAGTWVTYLDTKNPSDNTIKFTNSYTTGDDVYNIMVITKGTSTDSATGTNSDNAYVPTGEYSTLYIDNIVFFDADGNPIEVNAGATFAGPESYGTYDWSNLIEVKDQTVIDAFSNISAGGYGQAPDGVQQYRLIPDVDDDGNPVLDEDGNQTYTESGSYDWASIIKPGLVLTIYFTSESTSDGPMWMVTGDWSEDSKWGWSRIMYDDSLAYGTAPINDSRTMCQITYDDIKDFMESKSGMSIDELDLANRDFMFQLESDGSWSVSCMTYAYVDAE